MMTKDQFQIGLNFNCGDRNWRCTDIGNRVVIAICTSNNEDDQSWLNGPPYAVVETVFDENDFESCSIQHKKINLLELLPENKLDTDKLASVIETNLWKEEGVLDEFMTYFQDSNWPITQNVSTFFDNLDDKRPLINPLKRALRKSLATKDDFWGLNLMTGPIQSLPPLMIGELEGEINEWSRSDLFSSIDGICIMAKFRLGNIEVLKNRIKNLISATESWNQELKSAQKSLE